MQKIDVVVRVASKDEDLKKVHISKMLGLLPDTCKAVFFFVNQNYLTANGFFVNAFYNPKEYTGELKPIKDFIKTILTEWDDRPVKNTYELHNGKTIYIYSE